MVGVTVAPSMPGKNNHTCNVLARHCVILLLSVRFCFVDSNEGGQILKRILSSGFGLF
jgi:hypothetical protein